MKAMDAIRKPVVTVDAARPLGAVAELMDRHAVGALVVTDERGHAVGLVTDRDLVVRGLARGNTDGRCDSVMTTELVTADAGSDLREVIRLFETHAVRRVVLLSGDTPVGGLSVDDLLVDLVADLATVVRPVTAEVLFGHRDAGTLAVT